MTADLSNSSSREDHPFRLGSLRSVLPLSDDNFVSTRGQKLPGLIHSRSTRGKSQTRQKAEDESDGINDRDSIIGNDPERGLERRMSLGQAALNTPQMRSMRLIGKSNPRYDWKKYYTLDEDLKAMRKPLRKYYERNNFLISRYLYIDQLLDSTLPHNLIQEYDQPSNSAPSIPQTINEEPLSSPLRDERPPQTDHKISADEIATNVKVKRTPKALYKVPNENSPLLGEGGEDGPKARDVEFLEDESIESGSPIVTVAIYINLAANAILLAGKIAVIVLTSSLSVLASLVDAALDFLSTAIVWVTTKLISRQDQYSYPVGRRRLEPIGVLVFSVIMMTSFVQVALQCLSRLTSDDHSIVRLGIPSIVIMASTVIIKAGCWFWCRLVKNSSVQALAQDAMTDVVFNIFSIIFPLIGYYAQIWWLDALGGLLLSLYVIVNWANTSASHIRNLTGAAATADERNVLLYLTMRFAKTIKQIQGLQAYHAGDKLNVEVDIVLDESTSLRDSHDLGESLQYVLESVPMVDRGYIHMDYSGWNLPSHLEQQE